LLIADFPLQSRPTNQEDTGMFRIVKSNPKTKKEVRRERATSEREYRSPIFSLFFTRALLVLCVLLLGFIIGFNVNEKQTYYSQERFLLRQEERLLADKMLQDQEQLLLQQKSQVVASAPGYQPTVGVPSPATAQQAYQQPVQVQPQPNYAAQPQPNPTAPYQPAPVPAQIEPATPRQPLSSANADLDRQLAAIREEREFIGKQFADMSLNNGGGPKAPPIQPQPAQPAQAQQPGVAPEADGSNSSAFLIGPEQIQLEEKKPVSAAEQRIIDAPAVAKVVKYDADWLFVVLDGGSTRNIVSDQKFAVRRGGELICIVQVDEVDIDHSTADLIGPVRHKPDAPKPQEGDDVIGYPLF
jgi:hypothetical protein